jgi:hypothetical protein
LLELTFLTPAAEWATASGGGEIALAHDLSVEPGDVNEVAFGLGLRRGCRATGRRLLVGLLIQRWERSVLPAAPVATHNSAAAHASAPMRAATRTRIHSDHVKCHAKKWTLMSWVFWIMKITSATTPMSERITPAPIRPC